MPRRKIDLSTSGESRIIDMKTGMPVRTPVLPVICAQVKLYRERLNIEQKELAHRLDITANTISNWENGRSRPDVNLLPALCEALHITFYDLFNMEDPTIRYTADQQNLIAQYDRLSSGHQYAVRTLIDSLDRIEASENCPNLRILTHFSRQLAAGIGDPSELVDEGERVYVYSSPEAERADCIFTVNGESMEPKFHSGQDVLVQRIPNGPDLNYGEIGAFIIGNEAYIKEYQEDGLHSLNPDYPTMRFEDEDRVYLIGRVLGVFDKDQYAKPADIQKYQLVHGED